MATTKSDSVDSRIATSLQKLHSHELSGLIRYLHYAHMIVGANRIPIVHWFRQQAAETMEHAWKVGEKMTALGLHPEIVTLTHVEHRLLLDALTRRDGEDAARVLRMHIRRTRLGLTQHPELFDS